MKMAVSPEVIAVWG